MYAPYPIYQFGVYPITDCIHLGYIKKAPPRKRERLRLDF